MKRLTSGAEVAVSGCRILSIGCNEPLYTCPDDQGFSVVAASVKDLFMQGQS